MNKRKASATAMLAASPAYPISPYAIKTGTVTNPLAIRSEQSERYAAYDPQERLLARGQETVRDLNDTFKLRGPRTWSEKESPYVTELVRGWASTELRRAVKSSEGKPRSR